MTSVGACEAKTQFAELLQRVEHGEKIVITRRGKAVAMLVPIAREEKSDIRKVIEQLKAYSKRQGRTLGSLAARELIEAGRRH
ncbi:MAG: type II toxin-antitoxin system prevent-host-death family antitoxin [Pirellulales bacterium]